MAAIAQLKPEALLPDSGLQYEQFLDSLLDRDTIVYDPPLNNFGQVSHFSREWGATRADPPKFAFGETEFRMTPAAMQVLNEDGNRLYSIPYNTDTAFTFHFRGRRFGWAVASFEMCNGTGCLEAFYFLADFTHRHLYAFTGMALPSCRNYFGDLNHDGQLDLLIPAYLYYPGSQQPRSDTVEFMTLTAWTLPKAGPMRTIREDGQDCQYFLKLRIDEFEARKLEVLGCHGAMWY